VLKADDKARVERVDSIISVPDALKPSMDMTPAAMQAWCIKSWQEKDGRGGFGNIEKDD